MEAALGPVHPGCLASQPGSTPFPGQAVLIHLKEGKEDVEFRAFSLKSPFSLTSLSYFSALSALVALGAGRAGTVSWVESTSSAGKNLVKAVLLSATWAPQQLSLQQGEKGQSTNKNLT